MNDSSKNLPAEVDSGTIGKSISARAMSALAIPEGFRIARHVTRPVLQQEDGYPFYVKFETAAIEGQALKPGRGGAAKMAPARVADVVNLQNGDQCTLIMNAVLESELDRVYPELDYVGRSFAIVRGDHPDKSDTDKRYKLYRIVELVADDNATLHSAGKGVIDGTTKEAVEHAKNKKGV